MFDQVESGFYFIALDHYANEPEDAKFGPLLPPAVKTSAATSPLVCQLGCTWKLKIVRSAERVIGCHLPSIEVLHDSRARKRAGKIIADPFHPFFQRLPSGKQFRSITTKTSRHLNRFFPRAMALTNRPPDPQ